MSNWHYGIPKRENELRAAVKSPVITSQLSPEELEEIRQKYPATKADKAFKKPIEIKPRPKGDNDMAKFTLTEEKFNAERAAGKSVAKIAKEQGVSEVTIYNHVSKWADARKPAQEKLLREKDVSPGADPKVELLDKAEKEIERLTTENQDLRDRVEVLKADITVLVAENDQSATLCRTLEEERDELEVSRDDYKQMYERSYDRDTTANKKIGEHLETINSLRENSDSLIAENNRLSDRIVELEELVFQQETVKAVPDSEVQRLESAIQDLTRARWILNRLSASGE
ncbi:hypothetical protein [Paenibacillus amylolyticus]|uniref:hypothetical protein n=1 Tax=Paenibacillus amylolyticus TaxID=1451 RepID=UPI003D97DECB